MEDEGERCVDEDDEEIQLELDVFFNEFDDELLDEDELISKPSSTSQIEEPAVIQAGELNKDQGVSKSSIQQGSNQTDHLSSVQNKGISLNRVKECDNSTDEDGLVLSSDEEMEVSEGLGSSEPVCVCKPSTASNDRNGNESNNSKIGKEVKVTNTNRNPLGASSVLKRTLDSDARGTEMEVDIKGASLTFNDEESRRQKIKKVAEGQDVSIMDGYGSRELRSSDKGKNETKRNTTRGGKKKKKLSRYQQRLEQQRQRRLVKPSTSHLYKPLTVSDSDIPEVVAGELADRLEEEKGDLILRVVNCIGRKKALELFAVTKKTQKGGGISTSDGERRRTSGGVFLGLLKSKGYADREQVKEIYAVETERAKRLLKEQKAREREIREGRLKDLRVKIAQKQEKENGAQEK